jgi:hypothetical protein
MAIIDPPVVNMSRLRRSQRIHIRIKVVVALRGGNGECRTEETSTRIVSVHGALLLLQMGVDVGEVLTVTNVQTQEEALCRVVNLECSDEPGMQEVGIEFIEPAPKFWGVFFPPESWTPRSPEAKSYTRQTAPLPLETKK